MNRYRSVKWVFLGLLFLGGSCLSYLDGNQDRPAEYLISGLILALIGSTLWGHIGRRIVFGILLSRAPKDERNDFIKRWAVWRGSRLLFGGLWYLYQIVLVLGGVALFYWLLGDTDDYQFPILWIFIAFCFGFLFAWIVTLLTSAALDRLYILLGYRRPE